MSVQSTESTLRIFVDGNEVSGLTAYGYWAGTREADVSFPTDSWPRGTHFRDQWLRKLATWRL